VSANQEYLALSIGFSVLILICVNFYIEVFL